MEKRSALKIVKGIIDQAKKDIDIIDGVQNLQDQNHLVEHLLCNLIEDLQDQNEELFNNIR